MYKVDIGTVSDYIKEEWLEPLGLSLRTLEEKTRIPVETIQGKQQLSEEECQALAHYFGVSKNYFLEIQTQYKERQ